MFGIAEAFLVGYFAFRLAGWIHEIFARGVGGGIRAAAI